MRLQWPILAEYLAPIPTASILPQLIAGMPPTPSSSMPRIPTVLPAHLAQFHYHPLSLLVATLMSVGSIPSSSPWVLPP